MKNCSWQFLAFLLLLLSISCKQEDSQTAGTTDKVPSNLMLWSYTTTTITPAWDKVAGATSYTVQLLDSLDSEKPLQAYTTTTKDFHQFAGLLETKGYFVRVRANEGYNTGQWVYIMNGTEPGRIMPKYGFVAYNFEEPIPEPVKEPLLYANFPEGWENHDSRARKASHTGLGPTLRQSDVFPTGEWLMDNMYTNSASAIVHKVGTWGVMMNSNVTATLAMDFDLPNGARKFSFVYGAATTTNANETTQPMRIELTVEYSQDSGVTWKSMGDPLVVDDVNVQYFKEYTLDIKGPVRFRISKNASRARPVVDEIAVYY